MGIDVETARFIMRASRKGVSLKRAVTIGRQNLLLGTRELQGLFDEFEIDADAGQSMVSENGRKPFAENFFRALGAGVCEALDASGFEGASVIHDLNHPLPAELRRRFDTVLELGTLEHVFDFPTAMGNCLQMVRSGGHLIWVTPGNNLLGHGFYQFSPELVYRVLSAENGFKVEELVAVEYGPRRRWRVVSDPAEVRRRVQLINHFPVYLMTRARRISDVDPFRSTPQQSDYSVQWQAHAVAEMPRSRINESLGGRLKNQLIERMPRLTRALQALQTSPLNRKYSFRNKDSYKLMSKKDG